MPSPNPINIRRDPNSPANSYLANSYLEQAEKWNVSIERYLLPKLMLEGSVELINNEPIPTPEFVNQVINNALLGTVTVIDNWPELDPSNSCCALAARDSCLQSTLVRFQTRFATTAAEIMQHSGDPLSEHAMELIHNSRVKNDGDLPVGFTSHSAKVLPIHLDLARYESGGIKPAAISILAWVGRENLPSGSSIHFVDIKGYIEKGIVEKSSPKLLTKSKPELQIIPEDIVNMAFEAQSVSSLKLADYSLTIFTNRGLAHGATWLDYRNNRSLNRLIDQQRTAEQLEQPLVSRPIHISLL